VFPAKESLCAHARAKVGRTHPVLLFILVTLVFSFGPSIALAQQLSLSWTDNSGGQAGFVIQRGTSTSGPYAEIAQVSLGVTSYSDTAVSFGATYCYRVAAVAGGLVSDFSNLACASPSGVSPSSMFNVAASKTGTGTGLVSSSPAGIDCGTTCSYTYLAGTVVTVATTPSSGSMFRGWSGGGCNGTSPCTLAGNGSVTVTATFDTTPTPTPTPTSPSYTLAVITKGPGTISSSSGGISCGSVCSAAYASGTVVTLTATPGNNARFGGWYGGGCSGTGTCTVTVDKALSVTAAFKGGRK
jgi:Divergent InlB B-repeat domain